MLNFFKKTFLKLLQNIILRFKEAVQKPKYSFKITHLYKYFSSLLIICSGTLFSIIVPYGYLQVYSPWSIYLRIPKKVSHWQRIYG